MIELVRCPLCQYEAWRPYLTCKDYTASGEEFQLKECSHCNFIATNPAPAAEELNRYYQSDQYISHTGGQATLMDRLYRYVRNINLKWKESIIREYADHNRSLLDYGCGTGEFINHCNEQNWTVRGVEPNEKAREQAKRNGLLVNVSIESVPLQYRIITLWHVLEHVMPLKSTLHSILGKLEEGGTIFIAVPNCQSHDAWYYQQYWAGYDVPRHLWHFGDKQMENFLRQHGLNIKRIVPMTWDAYYVSLLSERYRGSSLAPLRGLWRGLISNFRARTTNQYSSLLYIAQP